MDTTVIQAMRDHAVRVHPKEAVGFVVSKNGQETYLPATNVHEQPEQFFRTRPEDWAMAEDTGEIIALVHSHPDKPAQPSMADRVICEAMAAHVKAVPWYIVEVRLDGEVKTGEVFSFSPCGYQAPLVGRSFHHGILDCYSIVRDYYAREMGIDLIDFERSDNWWQGEQELYLDGFPKAGFYELPEDAPLRAGDVLLMQLRSHRVNHAAVFLGGKPLKERPDMHVTPDMMLHHLYNRLSDTAIYGGYWLSATRKRLRHKDV